MNMMTKAVWGSSSHSSARRVLIVEDNPASRRMLSTACQMEGYDVHLACDGRDALRELRAGGVPDVILLDLHMPVMDGWQFREAQMADPTLAGIPVVVVSATHEMSPRCGIEPAPLGAFGKPVDLEGLLEMLRAIPRH